MGEVGKALESYLEAGDYLNAVRLYCFTDDLEKACDLAEKTKDKAAAYHVARQLESNGEFRKAVKFFAKAHAYGGAIALCKDQGLDDLMPQLALMSNESDQIDVARYFEDKPGHTDKAVMLYHKAGSFGRALDLAFRTEQFSSLDLIASDLSASSDPRVLERCAEFFIKNQQFDRAVKLLAFAKKFEDAIDLFTKKNVAISEEVAETLTPTKVDIPDAMTRNRLLEKLADCCMEQGFYHVAAKKYTQAGCKEKAMKALVKSGDTQTILRFANRAGHKETKIQIMAANFLQSVDWRQYKTSIKKFYQNAGAHESVAGFCEAMAQGEIDENGDYEAAVGYLKEGTQALSAATNIESTKAQSRIASINQNLKQVEKFIATKKEYDNNPADALQKLQGMLTESSYVVRQGDIYALLIKHYLERDNHKRAKDYLDDLKRKHTDTPVSKFLTPDLLQNLEQGGGSSGGGATDSMFTDDAKDAAEDGDTVPEAAALKRRPVRAADDDDWLTSGKF